MQPSKTLTAIASAVLIGGLLATPTFADVRLPSLFSDHMVLQGGGATAVWGWADPAEKIEVEVADQVRTTEADAAGKWMVRFEMLPGGKSTTLQVKGKNLLTVNDVQIGEVWLASGQSNMQMTVGGSHNGRAEVAAATFPEIRMFTVDRKAATAPQDDCGGKWIVCSPETAGGFSAAAYFFGREIHRTLKTPVGLINASWGGTTIEAWTSMDAQKNVAEIQPILRSWEQKVRAPFDEKQAAAQYGKWMEVWEKQVAKANAEGRKPPPRPKQRIAPRLQSNHPANLFNGMIAPLIPYTIRGAIWYQGESNSGNNSPAVYATQLPLLLTDWRTRWGQGDFPFAWVQLPNFRKRNPDPGAPSNWALMREVFLNALSVPNTGMAVTIDVGNESDIHPKYKQAVGRRLAFWALAKVYGKDIPWSGPLSANHVIAGSEVIVSFNHADGGLEAKGGPLRGFAIAGADRKWFHAHARIEGNQVIASSPDVPAPVALRYAWADNPECNLHNSAGLPASPFRTDDW
jgi:sialate O-acetylesterase